MICFASHEYFEGCITACRNIATVLGVTWAVIPATEAPPASLLDAELAILSSWHPRYEPLLAEHRGAIVPRWHSPLLQTEMSAEGELLARIVALLDEGAIPALAVTDPAFATALGRDGVITFPDLLDLREYAEVAPKRLRGTNVSLFGAPSSRKNFFVQSAAFEQVRRAHGDVDWTLHLNGQSFMQPGVLAWLEAAGVSFVDHGWLSRAEYLSLAAAMDAALCATLSEAFCYVAADHVALGVPVVASPTIACLAHGDTRSRLRPDDVGEVAASLEAALANGLEIARRQRETLAARAATNASLARTALEAIVSRTRDWRARRGSTRRGPRA